MNWLDEWQERGRQFMEEHEEEIEAIREQYRLAVERHRSEPPLFVTPKMDKLLADIGFYEEYYGLD